MIGDLWHILKYLYRLAVVDPLVRYIDSKWDIHEKDHDWDC